MNNDVTHALQLKLHERMNQNCDARWPVVVTPYGQNENLDNKKNKTRRKPIMDPAIAVQLRKKRRDK